MHVRALRIDDLGGDARRTLGVPGAQREGDRHAMRVTPLVIVFEGTGSQRLQYAPRLGQPAAVAERPRVHRAGHDVQALAAAVVVTAPGALGLFQRTHVVEQLGAHLRERDAHVEHFRIDAESFELRDRPDQQPACDRESAAIRVQGRQRRVRRSHAFHVTGAAEQDARMGDLALRLVEPAQAAERQTAVQMRATEPDRLVERIEQGDRLRIAAFGHVHAPRRAFDRCRRDQRLRAQQRLRFGRQFVEQCRVGRPGDVHAARAIVDFGALQANARFVADFGGRGVEQRCRGTEPVREHVRARALQESGGRRIRIRIQRLEYGTAVQLREQAFAGLARRCEHLGGFATGFLPRAAFLEFESHLPAIRALRRERTHHARRADRVAPLRGFRHGVTLGLDQADHGLARHDRLAAVAQVAADRVHHAERNPRRVTARRHFDRENHDRIGRRRPRIDRFDGGLPCRFRRRRPPPPCPDASEQHDAEHARCDRNDASPPARRSRTRRRRSGIPTVGRLRVLGGCAFGRALHGRDPAVAEARHRTQHLLFVAAVAEHAPRLHHGLVQHRIGDVRAAPDRRDQLVAPDRALAMRKQVRDAVEHRRRKHDEFAVAPHFARAGIELDHTDGAMHAPGGGWLRSLALRRRFICRHAASLSHAVTNRPFIP